MAMWGGILKGMNQNAEEALAEDKLALMRSQEERLEETFQINKRSSVISDLATMTASWDGSSSKKNKNSSTSSSLSNDVEHINTLVAIEDMLPENSPLVLKLANAPLESLQEVTTIIANARKASQSRGLPFTDEAAEELFQDYYTTTVTKKSPFNAAELAKTFAVKLDDDAGGGRTYADLFANYTKDRSVTKGFIVQNTPTEPLTVQEQNALTSQYNSMLRSSLLAIADQIQLNIAEGNTDESTMERANNINSALEEMKGENPSNYLATKLIGPEVGAQMIARNPRLSGDSYRSLINKGLTFTRDAMGDEKLSIAVKSGLLNIGDSYFHGGSQTLSQQDYQRIMGN